MNPADADLCARCGFEYSDAIHLPHDADPTKESRDGLIYCVFLARCPRCGHGHKR